MENYRPFKCDVCRLTLPNWASLLSHKSKVHPKNISRKCDKCGVFFASKPLLISHRTDVHGDRHPFQCDTCDKVLCSTSSLTRHKVKVHQMSRPVQAPNDENKPLNNDIGGIKTNVRQSDGAVVVTKEKSDSGGRSLLKPNLSVKKVVKSAAKPCHTKLAIDSSEIKRDTNAAGLPWKGDVTDINWPELVTAPSDCSVTAITNDASDERWIAKHFIDDPRTPTECEKSEDEIDYEPFIALATNCDAENVSEENDFSDIDSCTVNSILNDHVSDVSAFAQNSDLSNLISFTLDEGVGANGVSQSHANSDKSDGNVTKYQKRDDHEFSLTNQKNELQGLFKIDPCDAKSSRSDQKFISILKNDSDDSESHFKIYDFEPSRVTSINANACSLQKNDTYSLFWKSDINEILDTSDNEDCQDLVAIINSL